MTFQLTELNPGDTGVLPHQLEESDRLEDDIASLQGILAGATSLSQSTLLLQKRKDMKQVDALLAKTKAECVRVGVGDRGDLLMCCVARVQ